MKAFAILALLPLVISLPESEKREASPQWQDSYQAPSYQAPAPAYHTPAPSYHTPAPSYHTPAPSYHTPAPSYHTPAPSYGHAPSYGYEESKHNCSVLEVNEYGQVCTPVIETKCEPLALPIKIIKDIDYTYDIFKTVCIETTETRPQKVCKYTYDNTLEDTYGKTYEVTFEKKTNFEMITVCHPGHGKYNSQPGYGGYGKHSYHKSFDWNLQHCKDVMQETHYLSPVVEVVKVPVQVSYPEPIIECYDKPIELPVVQCAPIQEEKTIQVPTVENYKVSVDICRSKLVDPSCKKAILQVPKQVCQELNFGYAHDTVDTYSTPEPSYAPYA